MLQPWGAQDDGTGGSQGSVRGRQDLEELAGIAVKTNEVERVAESIGAQVEETYNLERKAIVTGKVIAMASAPNLYVAVDGTCVPMVGRETEGRKGRRRVGQGQDP